MALISVDRKPTILGTATANVVKYQNGPGTAPYEWVVLRSGDFTSQGGGTTAGNLRFHTIVVSNNGPVVVRMVMDTSTAAAATTADYPFSTGIAINVGETLTLDVSTLGGAQGIRRILLVNDIYVTAPDGEPPYADYTVSYIDFQVGFYTQHQSA
jgi:hypothetical protein